MLCRELTTLSEEVGWGVGGSLVESCKRLLWTLNKMCFFLYALH